MRKIANTTELQTALNRLLDYAQSERPSRVRIAKELALLGIRVAADAPKLKCDMNKECDKPATHTDGSFIYCADHAKARSQWKRCRKLKPAEIKSISESQSRSASERLASEKRVRFPEGVMTEQDWVDRYADRVEEYKVTADRLMDRNKYNRLEGDAQEAYEKELEEKAKKPRYRAWKGNTFYDISKSTYMNSKNKR